MVRNGYTIFMSAENFMYNGVQRSITMQNVLTTEGVVTLYGFGLPFVMFFSLLNLNSCGPINSYEIPKKSLRFLPHVI